MDDQMRHINIVVQQLNQFSPENETIRHFLDESTKVLQSFKVTNETFLMETLCGCIEYKPLLDVVVSAYYSRDGKHCLLSERNLYIVVCYLAIFRLDELGLQQFSRMVKSMDVAKICKFLRFFFNSMNLNTWIKDEWNQIYDSVYVNNKWIKPLQRLQPKVQQLIDQLDDKFGKYITTTSKITEPKEFKLTVPHPRPILIPELILQQEKTKPIPVNTYKPPKLRQKLEQIKLENRRKAEELLLEANINQFNCAAPKNDHKSPIASEIRNYSEKFQAQKIQGKVDNIPVKLNSTAILREGVLYQRKVEQELNRIEHLLRGARDPSEFLEWQKQMCGKDLDQQLIEEECRRLQGKLSYEEAILARQNCIRENQKKAEQKREKKEELSQQCAQRNLQEMKERKKTVQQVTEARKNVKQARLKLQKYKRQIVQEVSEENQQILIQALKEEEEKIKKRCELIQQIRAIEYLPILKSKFVDLTQTPDHGVLGEMSIVELQERLALLKEAQKKTEEEKRDQIILEKHMKEQLLLGKLEQISTFREQLGRAAALKQEKKKIKTTFHGSIWKDEQVLDLQKKIEKKSMERKIPPEYLKTKPQKLHEGSKRSSISQKKYQQEDMERNWKKIERTVKMLQLLVTFPPTGEEESPCEQTLRDDGWDFMYSQ
ncbi:cilia- and flagella-associated protein 99 [Sceloporus undulatus]|uniref:cilia- and flagella-associated protein 99 n=1 Tax=Sceloporus undulatus TaxID=8520 RepID=UPI001C4C5B33|nr:cilia- and flagella-associated protein 99 [Sceloporus undulatus]